MPAVTDPYIAVTDEASAITDPYITEAGYATVGNQRHEGGSGFCGDLNNSKMCDLPDPNRSKNRIALKMQGFDADPIMGRHSQHFFKEIFCLVHCATPF